MTTILIAHPQWIVETETHMPLSTVIVKLNEKKMRYRLPKGMKNVVIVEAE